MYITTCLHGVDLRFTPRCYLCKPWPDDSPVWKVTSPGHVHEGEWCAMCVEHGRVEGRRVVMTWDAYIEAHAGRGHVGQDHTRESVLGGGCGLCASAEYGTEVEMAEYAIPALRAALEEPPT